ncbi:hypothetical protein ACG5V6_24325 [Streptomyces chitinivorans]|uniref:Uncharacterized protein n=1 Tax=Streptomyces chitinivorans TaxID=1257027 RepID=A0ABW7HZL4_9ACTN|nr:hypothetical protein [Streptomyces chitinivorans]MDH2407306.1 hypothetical protein [Streptomyces chitinivorans]
MTISTVEAARSEGAGAAHPGLTIAADGSYAARLAPAGDGRGRIPERWTLDGPEPYAVPLPGPRPEGPDAQVLPLPDGRVLICRAAGGRCHLALLYPAGPGTGELPLGSVDCEGLRLLPPAPHGSYGPCGSPVHALAPGEHGATVWLVHGGPRGPEPVAEVPGRCSGGTWLDREGRLLALDRTDAAGRTKTVAVDLGRGGEVFPLLELTDDSDDRLLLADPDSGLLLLRSDAPGEARLGWGVLGSHRPVRFPDALSPPGVALTPFAVQPGQALTPEGCAVALRADGPNGTWVAVWRPSQRRLRHLPAPVGWVRGTGLWTAEGELRLPCAGGRAGRTQCGLARITPSPEPGPPPARPHAEPAPEGASAQEAGPAESGPAEGSAEGSAEGGGPLAARAAAFTPVPLQQAPLARKDAERRS